MASEAPPLQPWRAAVARLSSGTKMLFIMGGALMPLGLIALLASLQYSSGKRQQHLADARLVATSEARQLDITIFRAANVIRFASGAALARGARCPLLIGEAQKLLPHGTRLALFSPSGQLRCVSDGFLPAGIEVPQRAMGVEMTLLGSGGLRFTALSESGAFGVGELPPEALRNALGTTDRLQGVTLSQGGQQIDLVRPSLPKQLERSITADVPFGVGQLRLTSVTWVNAISAIEMLLVMLPLLMWAAAAAIGWIVINELLLRPLGRLQRAVRDAADAGAASGIFVMPRLQTPALEIRTLAEAFSTATEQLAQRESRLEEGLRHQVLLTREVHHRVKNNLQVVASLINLHARGTTGDVAAAYASIQRRVDALAVVHRNHYAELEKHHGVSLRALVAELTANLRATAPVQAANFSITLDMAPVHVSQDVAVPVAFLLTELIELLMENAPTAPTRIVLMPTDDPERALLRIVSSGLEKFAEGADPALDRFVRIIAGLARQLRSTLAYDGAAQHYQIAIPILPEAKAENPHA